MSGYICLLTAAALRAEPNHRSELVSQLLFGERVEVLDKFKGWMLVKSLLDDYTGWVDMNQLEPCDESESRGKPAVSKDLFNLISEDATGNRQWITFGALVDMIEPGRLILGGRTYHFRGDIKPLSEEPKPDEIMRGGLQWLNVSYLWGGRTPLGVDCSGFVQLVYRAAGIILPRDAWQQAELGVDIPFASEAREGDLAFFENPEGSIVHVGILNGEGHIIHASGKVRIDACDHQGIFNNDIRRYTHKLKMIKRII
ncbi:MAG: NlpC/P60 family protein [Bacteroidales bacterium]